MGIEFASNALYRAPAYLQLAAKRKCNRSDIFILGVLKQELQQFWQSVSFHALSFTRPVEEGRAVVDIDCRCHKNTADVGIEKDDSDEKPEDWFDEFSITSSKDVGTTNSKSYQLQLNSSTTKGANFNFKIAGAGFFNVAAPSVGLTGSYSTTTGTSLTTGSARVDRLSQGYQIVDTLKIPPKTKVKATITTWAVTYTTETVTEFTVDANAELSVHYRTYNSRKRYGGIFVKKVCITAKELFCNELDYKCIDGTVTFKRKGTISYLGEEVEIIKERDPCTLEEELNLQARPIQ